MQLTDKDFTSQNHRAVKLVISRAIVLLLILYMSPSKSSLARVMKLYVRSYLYLAQINLNILLA